MADALKVLEQLKTSAEAIAAIQKAAKEAAAQIEQEKKEATVSQSGGGK
jgi:hypothetical protein